MRYMATPLCRCRVLYLGCAVPKITKDGLQGIQEPLKEIYPEGGSVDATGIDAWLIVWSNGLLLEYLDSMGSTVTKFMPIDTLHYCAAVRYVEVNSVSTASPASEVVSMRFFPLDSPRATPTHHHHHHPPLFACIMRRTSGIKVLECHGFIGKNELAANALVKACFHAYSDSMNLRLYTDFAATPHLIPVIIPKKKSIFKFGKKSRSKSIGPTYIPVHPIPMRSPSPSINLDPYGYNRVYDWRTPTPRPIYLPTVPPPSTPIQSLPVRPADYRYVSSPNPRGRLGSSMARADDNPKRQQSRTATVWPSRNNNTTANGASHGDRDHYLYDNVSPGSRMVTSRVSSRGPADEVYADVRPRQRGRSPANSRDTYGNPRVFSPMTFYKAPESPVSQEHYYEATTVERRKNSGQTSRNQDVNSEQVIYRRSKPGRAEEDSPPPLPAPYEPDQEKTRSNGGYLYGDRRLSTFKRYESMPELSSSIAAVPVKNTKKKTRDQELPGMMDGLKLRNGSAGSAEQTPVSTPTSTPALSLSEYYRESRNGKPPSPIIPAADYHR